MSDSRSWKLGFLLCLGSIFLWGFQPLAVGALVRSLSPAAIAFYKLSSASLFFLLFAGRKKWQAHSNVGLFSSRKRIFLLLAGALSLSSSSAAFNAAFLFVSPSNTQVYFQLSRLLLALAGIFLFEESFNPRQWAGLVILFLGVGIFYHDQISFAENRQYYIGVSLVLFSAVGWAAFAVAQKYLIREFSSVQIFIPMYLLATLSYLPFAKFVTLASLQSQEWLALGYICISNCLAFWLFSESLRHWEAAKVSAVSCLTPFVTILGMLLASHTFGVQLKTEYIGLVAILGALLVMAGAGLISFGSASAKN